MNAKLLFAATALAAIAAAASGIAQADEADGSQFALRIDGSRTRAEVAAEAARVPLTRSQEPAGSRVLAPLRSDLQTQSVRAQAIDALRLGKIPSGERSL
ncbi:DUF4148 domain-containing protein [Ramlibacter alkalitolerans]|uniref:DUF4148 domain-containing protein n=1 Tax=Ramlibacter alkalitolerans TaxID=2039631 RepID=A0ABS1JI31_9BURK|nr:DUF4148 domain-containing protein [Ramlibacter alkalitolerans]MBL0423873.1 DUF4148 domain-containing protein [Ramlibacter alkalitolerans]